MFTREDSIIGVLGSIRCHGSLGLTPEVLFVEVIAAAELARASALELTVLDQPFGLAVYREGAYLPAILGYSTSGSSALGTEPVLEGPSNALPGSKKLIQVFQPLELLQRVTAKISRR